MKAIRKPTRRQLARVGILALQWLLLTIALGAVVVYSADSFEGHITPNLDGSLIFLGAFVAAFVLGMSVESFKVLMPLTLLMIFGAGLVFVFVLFAPSYAEVTIRTTALENHAATRVFLFSALMFLPAVVGAGFGNLAGGYFQDNILGPLDQQDGVDMSSWYARRNQAAAPTDQVSRDH